MLAATNTHATATWMTDSAGDFALIPRWSNRTMAAPFIVVLTCGAIVTAGSATLMIRDRFSRTAIRTAIARRAGEPMS